MVDKADSMLTLSSAVKKIGSHLPFILFYVCLGFVYRSGIEHSSGQSLRRQRKGNEEDDGSSEEEEVDSDEENAINDRSCQ